MKFIHGTEKSLLHRNSRLLCVVRYRILLTSLTVTATNSHWDDRHCRYQKAWIWPADSLRHSNVTRLSKRLQPQISTPNQFHTSHDMKNIGFKKSRVAFYSVTSRFEFFVFSIRVTGQSFQYETKQDSRHKYTLFTKIHPHERLVATP